MVMGYINRPNNFTTFLVNPGGGGMLGILWCLLPSSREVRTANSAASLPLKVFILNTYLLYPFLFQLSIAWYMKLDSLVHPPVHLLHQGRTHLKGMLGYKCELGVVMPRNCNNGPKRYSFNQS